MNHFLKKIFFQKWIVQPLLVVLILFVMAGTALAINAISEGYRLNSGAQTISGYSACYTAKTTSGSDVFFPTRTAAEWSAFVAHKPANVSLGVCCTDWRYNQASLPIYVWQRFISAGAIKIWWNSNAYNNPPDVVTIQVNNQSITSYDYAGYRYERGSQVTSTSGYAGYSLRRCPL